MMIRQVPLFSVVFIYALSAPAELKDTPAKKENGKAAQEQTLKEGEHMKQTPFGQMKRGPAKKTGEPDVGRFVEVEEQGDTITFRRSTPFGNQVWKRQRAQLSEVEKKMLERHQKPAPEPAQAAKPDQGGSAKTSAKEAGR
jgi:hypothetical protein